MPFRVNRVIALRWIFLVAGLFLLGGGGIILGLNTTARQFGEMLYPGDPRAQRGLLTAVTLIPFMISVLCLASAWGIPRSKSWARITGIWSSVGLILMFSPLSLAGFWCLWALAKPLDVPPSMKAANLAAKSKDCWVAKRKSPIQRIIAGTLGVTSLVGLSFVKLYAHKLGMTSWEPGWLCLPFLLLIDVLVHEMGHVTMAWAMHNRLRVINAGPFTFQDSGHGFHFHFNWRRLFGAGGFVSSASLTGDNLRWKLVAEIAGGPAAALLGALVSTAIFLSLPGTGLQSFWWIPGYLAVIFLFDAIVNLIPVGYCDGSMLLHLILWTRAGQLLIGRSGLGHLREDADTLQDQADFVKVVEIWTPALEQAKAGGEENVFATAFCHERLAYAHKALHDWPAAEAHFRSCLEHEPECAFETALLVNSLTGLQRASFERHHVEEVGRRTRGRWRH